MKNINDPLGEAFTKFLEDNGAKVIDVTPKKKKPIKVIYVTKKKEWIIKDEDFYEILKMVKKYGEMKAKKNK